MPVATLEFSESGEPRDRDDRPFEAEITTFPSSRSFVFVLPFGFRFREHPLWTLFTKLEPLNLRV